MGLSASTSLEQQIDFDLATPQLIPIDKLLQYIYNLKIYQRIP